LAALIASASLAQAPDAKPVAAAMKIEPAPAGPHGYRVNFMVTELDAGKKMSSHQYSLDIYSAIGNEGKLRMNTKVSIDTTEGHFVQADVGIRIRCNLREQGDEVGLGVSADIQANVDSPVAGDDASARIRAPRRFWEIDGSVLATIGKPVLIGSVDDLSSQRQFQLEATVTRQR
jgi:hypothetical protein